MPVVRSIFSTRTRIFWPSARTSRGWPTRPQANWLTCSSPSTPPISTNAPKSISFRTTPSWMSARGERFEELLPGLFLLALQHGAAAEHEVPPRGFASVMTQVIRWPTNWARSSTRYSAIWLTGMKPRMWLTSHSSPPVLWPVTCASTSIPSFKSDQSPTSTALSGRRSSYRPSSGLSFCTITWSDVAGLRGRLELPQRQAALFAAAEIDKDLVAANGRHPAGLLRFRLQRLPADALRAAEHQGVQRGVAQGVVHLGVDGLDKAGRGLHLGRRRSSTGGGDKGVFNKPSRRRSRGRRNRKRSLSSWSFALRQRPDRPGDCPDFVRPGTDRRLVGDCPLLRRRALFRLRRLLPGWLAASSFVSPPVTGVQSRCRLRR